MGEGLLTGAEMTQTQLHHQNPPQRGWHPTAENLKHTARLIGNSTGQRVSSKWLSRSKPHWNSWSDCKSLLSRLACLRTVFATCTVYSGRERPDESRQFQELPEVKLFTYVPGYSSFSRAGALEMISFLLLHPNYSQSLGVFQSAQIQLWMANLRKGNSLLTG